MIKDFFTLLRKFFASILLLVFIAVVSPLIILQSFSSGFLNKDRVINVIVPNSYDIAIRVAAETVAKNPVDIDLFESRIKQALDKNIYVDLIQTAINSGAGVFDALEQGQTRLEINLQSLQNKLKTAVPDVLKKMPVCGPNEMKGEDFRFCMPRQAFAGQSLEREVTNFVSKQIPPKLTADISQNPQVANFLPLILIIKKYLPAIISIAAVIFLGFISLLVFRPWTSVMRWVGEAILLLGAFLLIFAFSMPKLPEIMSMTQQIPRDQIKIIMFIIINAFAPLKFWSYLIAAFGAILFVLSFIFRPKTKK